MICVGSSLDFGGILVAVFCAVLLDSRPFEERVMSGRRLAP